jgi:hypothetical protein
MKGIKQTDKKLVYDLDFEYIQMMAERMQLNRDKYPVGNWKKNIDLESLKQAMFRHMMEVMKGEYHDEQKFGHLIAMGCNAFMMIEQIKKNDKHWEEFFENI